MKKSLSCILCTVTIFLFPASAFCQINLVKDINDGMVTPNASSNPSYLTIVNDVAFFIARTPAEGIELWKTDGTPSGTVLVKDIYPGTASSDPANLINVNGTLFFSANNGENGRELWKSDGTEAGTVMVKDIVPDGSITVRSAANVNGTFYFGYGDDLWKSDGTSDGTSIVKAGVGYPDLFTNVNGVLFFRANLNLSEGDLWKSDGTAEGTVMIKDINPDEFSYINNLSSVNGTLYFSAYPGSSGEEPWKSDGTPEGTVKIKDINPNGGSYPRSFFAYHDSVYFSATDGVHGYEIWKSDGTEAGTVLLADMNEGANNFSAYGFVTLNDILYFEGSRGYTALYRTDGSASGTYRVDDAPSSVNILTIVNGMLFFEAYTASDGFALWVSDGTSAGTTQVKDINPYRNDFYFYTINNSVALGNKLLFNGYNDINGYELYASDGTPEGTSILREINQQGTTQVNDLTVVDDKVFFYAKDGLHGYEVWTSDGTTAGTMLTKDINPDIGIKTPINFFPFNNELYFISDDGVTGYQLWKSDGTTAGTSLVKEVNNGDGILNITQYVIMNDQLYFFVLYDGDVSMWRTDGTTAGTVELFTLPGVSSVYTAIAINNTIFFGAINTDNGSELWKSNGSQLGTMLVKDIYPGTTGSSPSEFYDVNGVLLFSADDAVAGRELWKSDGTTGGTVLVKDISTGSASSGISTGGVVMDNVLFFGANTSEAGRELWKTDGTTEGTVLVKDIFEGTNSSSPTEFTITENHVYFTIRAWGTTGQQLWRTDGTTEGTVLVKNDFKISAYTFDHKVNLVNVNNTLYAVHSDVNILKTEIWKINNTIACLQAEAEDLYVQDVVANGDNIFIQGHSYQQGGVELFAYNTSGDPECKLDQVITFLPVPAGKRANDDPFDLSATASSALPVTLTSSNPDVATLSGSQVTIIGPGETVITASQEGDEIWNAAPSVEQTLIIGVTVSAEKSAAKTISCYPNPFNDTFSLRVDSSAPTEITVHDITGMKIEPAITVQSNATHVLGERWPFGIYLLSIRRGNSMNVVKVAKYAR